MPRTDQQNRRLLTISLLIFLIFCIPLCFFVLSPPPKTFFFWLNDDLLPNNNSPPNGANPLKSNFEKNAPFIAQPKYQQYRSEKDESPPLLLLVSYDAFRYDYIEQHKNVTPTLQWLINNGVYATEGLKNTFITITAPNHYGIVTGLYEESHGIIANSFYDPAMNESFNYFDTRWETNPKFFAGNPIWITNDESGPDRASGCMMWVGCDLAINGKPPPIRRVSWDGNLDWAARIDSVISWFTHPTKPINFGLLYIEEPDETGHNYGPDSMEVTQMLRTLDQLTAYLLWRLYTAGLLEKINIIFTADHGMASVPVLNVVNMDQYLNRSMYTYYGGTPNWNVQPAPGKEEEVYNILHNEVPHLNVYNKTDIPQDFHYRNNNRIMDLQLVPDMHWWITYNYSGLVNNGSNRSGSVKEVYIKGKKHLINSPSKNYTTGEHGYNNSLPEMHPYFIGFGPAFKKGYNISQFMNIDLYQLMCYILRVKPSPNNGSFERVRSILKDEGVKWPKKVDNNNSFWKFWKDDIASSSSVSGFTVEYEFRGLHTNAHYDLVIMFFILICYVIYMAILIKSAKPNNRYSQKKLVEVLPDEEKSIYPKTV